MKMEQYAQLKIWIGRLRLYQASGDDGAGEETPAPLAQRVFHQLKGLSKQYEPGYIEAFRHDFTTDWTAYVAEAQEQLLQATEAARRPKDKEKEKEKDNEHPRPERPQAEARDDAPRHRCLCRPRPRQPHRRPTTTCSRPPRGSAP